MTTDRGPVRLAPLGRRLVAVLAASAGKVVSVDRLTEALWDGRPSADARNRVQAAVSALRRGLSALWPIEPRRPELSHQQLEQRIYLHAIRITFTIQIGQRAFRRWCQPSCERPGVRIDERCASLSILG
jgi:hypothetical protein